VSADDNVLGENQGLGRKTQSSSDGTAEKNYDWFMIRQKTGEEIIT
jgi:hypothetical protein